MTRILRFPSHRSPRKNDASDSRDAPLNTSSDLANRDTKATETNATETNATTGNNQRRCATGDDDHDAEQHHTDELGDGPIEPVVLRAAEFVDMNSCDESESDRDESAALPFSFRCWDEPPNESADARELHGAESVCNDPDRAEQEWLDRMAALEADAEAIRQRAALEGREEALAIAREEVRDELFAQLAPARDSLAAAAFQLRASHGEWQTHWREGLIRLAVRIAEKVIRREIAATPAITTDLVCEALTAVSAGERIRIRMSSRDADLLREEVLRHGAATSPLAKIELVIDNELASGDSIVETEWGAVDQRIEKQLARIEEELLQ